MDASTDDHGAVRVPACLGVQRAAVGSGAAAVGTSGGAVRTSATTLGSGATVVQSTAAAVRTGGAPVWSAGPTDRTGAAGEYRAAGGDLIVAACDRWIAGVRRSAALDERDPRRARDHGRARLAGGQHRRPVARCTTPAGLRAVAAWGRADAAGTHFVTALSRGDGVCSRSTDGTAVRDGTAAWIRDGTADWIRGNAELAGLGSAFVCSAGVRIRSTLDAAAPVGTAGSFAARRRSTGGGRRCRGSRIDGVERRPIRRRSGRL